MNVTLRTWHGTYLCAELDGRVVGDRASAGPWETWTLDLAAGIFQSWHGRYLCAEPDGRVVADRERPGAWETFHVLPGIEAGTLALQTAHATYVCVEPSGRVVADRQAVGPWETFLVETVAGDRPDEARPQPPPPSSPPLPSRPLSGEGGLRLSAADTSVRPRLSADQIRRFLPRRGLFTFPDPYGTTGIRITNEDDGPVQPVGYSYWRNSNNHVGRDIMTVFLGLDYAHGGPTLFDIDKASGWVEKRGPLFPAGSGLRWDEGQGWYFSATQPEVLYLLDGPRLQRYHIDTGDLETVFTAPDEQRTYLWQAHSSADDRVHSATLRDTGSYAMLGAITYREQFRERMIWARLGDDFDECQVDKSGKWLVVKEKLDGRLMNRIIDLATGRETQLVAGQGALGHSDNGFEYIVGEDGYHERPGAMLLRRFGYDRPTLVYYMHGWGEPTGMSRHVAHGNARPSDPASQFVVVSSAHRDDLARANEIVKVPLDGSLACTVICPNLVDLDAPGGGEDYRKLPKANLDVTGEYVIWSANMGTPRIDAFVAQVPR